MLRVVYIIFFALSISSLNGQNIQVADTTIDTRLINTDSNRIAGPPPEYFVVQIDTSFFLVPSEKVLRLNQKWIVEIKVLREPGPEIIQYAEQLTEGIIILRFKRSKLKKVKGILELE